MKPQKEHHHDQSTTEIFSLARQVNQQAPVFCLLIVAQFVCSQVIGLKLYLGTA
jgi:hypothetical protein